MATTGDRESSAELDAAAQSPKDEAVPDDAGYLGVIERAGLVAIVEQGLGHLFARLKVSPVLEGKRFRGFRVTALDTAWRGSGVRVGDVIQRLNGQPIERPEQAMAAFESLRVASEVAVELTRNGEVTWLRYRVE